MQIKSEDGRVIPFPFLFFARKSYFFYYELFRLREKCVCHFWTDAKNQLLFLFHILWGFFFSIYRANSLVRWDSVSAISTHRTNTQILISMCSWVNVIWFKTVFKIINDIHIHFKRHCSHDGNGWVISHLLIYAIWIWARLQKFIPKKPHFGAKLKLSTKIHFHFMLNIRTLKRSKWYVALEHARDHIFVII